jgi:hypothetical protein
MEKFTLYKISHINKINSQLLLMNEDLLFLMVKDGCDILINFINYL